MSVQFLNGIDLANQRITAVGDPSGATDGANKQYVDNVARGLYWKMPARAASTGNVSLTAPGTTIDGVTLNSGDRILLKNQTAGAENGIYTWTGSAATLTRTNDADTGTELNPGTAVTVTEGTVNADKIYAIISDAAVTIGTTSTTWGQLGGGTTYTASNGVQLAGSNFSGVAASGGGLTVGASGFSVDTTIVARKSSGNLGNGSLTSIAVAHNLNTQDVQVSLRNASTNAMVITDWVATDVNTVTFTFASAPASGAYRWTIEA
jgi:hypothetical protein